MSAPALEWLPPPGHVLCRVGAVPEGQAETLEFRQGHLRHEIFVLHHDGRFVAYVNACPNTGTPLDWQAGRFLSRDRTLIQCATHGARFRVSDGFCVRGPCAGKSLTPVPIALHDGVVVLAAGDAA
ncbi:MAG: Rieske 2Fe-2S domain-containing protein [Alphaproteobacteria bacterium]|nr:Rieske 2Fe-2S domain-containing protein [Alphaproteobacteria bacterium]